MGRSSEAPVPLSPVGLAGNGPLTGDFAGKGEQASLAALKQPVPVASMLFAPTGTVLRKLFA